ncbi:MAG TPA: hypothetical protein VEC19_16190 [Usitatibacter sp.]|nr:hypothetical protein [Usitatibacter sp.]
MKTLHVAIAMLAAGFALSAEAVGRLADLSIFDRSTGRELPVHWHEGRPYVVGKPGNEYQVVVRNRTGEDLLAVISVDGVNVVSGETAHAQQAGYVLDGRREARIAGWRKSLSETSAFYFTSLPDSYAGRTGRPNNVGVIGVAVFQRKAPPPKLSMQMPHEPWLKDKAESYSESASGSAAAPPSAAHDSASLKRIQPGSPLGTGHGRREASQVQQVGFERRTHEPVETLAIYYDSYRNLVAQGVLQTPRALRSPDPFPSRFAPDP